MYKAEAQRPAVLNQPSQNTQRQNKGASLSSPQGERIAQLETLANHYTQTQCLTQLASLAKNSPQALVQQHYTALINGSPQVTAQRQKLAGLSSSTVQRVEEEESCQGKLQVLPGMQTAERETVPAMSNRTGLPDNLKSSIETLSGMSMDNVRVHYNSTQPAQLNALAYAQGTDIHLAPGQEQHLPHETWHVVQQAQGRVKPTMQMKDGVQINNDSSLEREADEMGTRANLFKPEINNFKPATTLKLTEQPLGLENLVQRVVHWKGIKYRNRDAGVLGRALSKLVDEGGISQALRLEIIQHANDDNVTYYYQDMIPRFIRRQGGVQHPDAQNAGEQEPIAPQPVGQAPGLAVQVLEQVGQVPEQVGQVPEQVGQAPEQVEVPQNDLAQPAPAEIPVPVQRPQPQRGMHMNEAQWGQYQIDYATRTQTVNALVVPELQAGRFLYHETTKAIAHKIRDMGLTPKTVDRGDPSSSKDGYLSMATQYDKAAAIGGRGRNVKLRVTLNANEIATGNWRRASGSELLTTIAFLPGRLEWAYSGLHDWQAMNTYI